ncbi:MAG: hypothetical protein EBU23_03390 [Mycobacteriaceae bacterium]|nr:hypothetical protein [Mycobacteriaceae bacterium]NBQ41619.1 hypothetical protein [Mycobacteriaceae bacterium]
MLLSGSNQGQPILVAATSSPGTTIHSTGTSSTIIDNITLYAHNTDTTARKLTVEFGGTGTANTIEVTVPAESGLMLVVPQLPLTGTGAAAKTVAAFCASTNLVAISGVVDRIS